MNLALALALTLAAAFQPASDPSAPVPVLVVSGANNHDWKYTTPAIAEALKASGLFEVSVTEEPARTLADAAGLAQFRAFVLNYNGPRWGEPAESAFLAAVRAGAGVVVIHAANNAFEGWKEYELLVGDLWREGTGHGAYHRFDVEILDRDHPVTRGLGKLRAHPDELYHRLVRTSGAQHRPLAAAFSAPETGGSGRAEPMIWVGEYGQGRVFHTPLGHVWPGQADQRATWQDPQMIEVLLRGTEWAATGNVTRAPQQRENALSKVEEEQGWKLLFDGRTSAGWRAFRGQGFPAQGWSVRDGALAHAAGGGGGDLATEAEYGDFELEAEWTVAPGANSGIIYRASDEFEQTWNSGPEYQVLDDSAHGMAADDYHSAGALYELASPLGKTARPAGRWNQARIVLQGWDIEHWLNGVRVLKLDLASHDGQARLAKSKFASMPGFAKSARGRIVLQDHGDEVAYRSLKIRELGTKAVALFNGRDLSGWKAFLPGGEDPAQTWSVTGEGILVCTGKPAGYIRTEVDYANYVLEVEWRWNPVTKQEGNSGVLLRMIGEDKVWPKSLEAQLQSKNAGDFWVIDEFPCRTAPERTNGRNCKKTHGNEKPVGEWNRYRITVDRGTVTLEVNGQVLNIATEALETAGKICLQSEGAEIQFRSVVLTPIG